METNETQVLMKTSLGNIKLNYTTKHRNTATTLSNW